MLILHSARIQMSHEALERKKIYISVVWESESNKFISSYHQ